MAAYSEEAIRQALALVQEIEIQTDRGAAIIGAAWVEEELKAAIEAAVETDKKAWDRLFRRGGPLDSFSTKIDLARLLGVISPVVASDLHIIREIRNEFAHSVLDLNSSPLSFDIGRIKDKCLALNVVKHEEITVPRTAYVRACAVLNSDLFTYKLVGRLNDTLYMIKAHVEENAA